MTLILTDARQKGDLIREDCNEINLLETDEVKQAKLEMWIAKNVGTAVSRKYPGREWSVRVDIRGQMVVVQAPALSKSHGYHVAMAGRTIHELGERAVLAAGGILERYRISRARKFDDSVIDALARDHRDDVICKDASTDPVLKVQA